MGRHQRGWNWYAPYDKLNKCFLITPANYRENPRDYARFNGCDELGSYIAGQVWDWLRYTSVDHYAKHTTAKALRRRKLLRLNRALDKSA